MKRLGACAIIAIISLIWMTRASFAEMLVFPTTDEPLFYITLPDNWSAEIIEETILQAASQDDAVYMIVWPVEGSSIDEAAEMLDEYLSDFLYDLSLKGDGENLDINDIPLWQVEGVAKDIETDADVHLSLALFSPDDETVF